MGTYLANGIIKDITIPKRDMKSQKVTIDQVVVSLKDELNIDHYTSKEDADGYYWEINPKMLEGNLADFLAAQFAMYTTEKDDDMEEAISKIRKATSGKDIIKLADSQELIHFYLFNQLIDYLHIQAAFNPSVRVHYSMMAYFMDGKIIMECYENILRYFEHIIRLQRNQYPVVDCVKVMITS